jgi:hypothetical protein
MDNATIQENVTANVTQGSSSQSGSAVADEESGQ